ncbi:hypothetical protein [Sphingomonas sp.]|jgi:hypothetical protein|uniref:hypothetical protein n=1 Tax=Sphingomonas sp. TaxID=28214 RepID=UPI002D7E3A45|nr:hypothetical protein [Sphingomonas sp.]HEU0044186.1 hypothetical protein [Sphingomonas sp.]
MPTILEHLNWAWKMRRHLALARGVLDTPPIRPRNDGVVLFSMLGSRAVLPYLVAVKSLHHQLGRGRVEILDDGSLTAADRRTLAHHCGDPVIHHIDAVDTGPCPRGGTWERLLTILDLRSADYIVQIDSDTVTCGAVPEVAAAIEAGRSFTIRGEADAQLMPINAFVAQLPIEAPPLHIQKASERCLDALALPQLPAPRYVRGCAGFTGLAPSGDGRALAEAFSIAMEARLGAARWGEWGTEQVTSNFLIANTPDPMLLPYDRYLNFWNEAPPADARLVHYVGTYRFHGTSYMRATRTATAALSAA